MKNQTSQIIGRIRQLGLAALLTTGLASQAQTTLYDGHTDVGIDYDETLNAWNLHVHYEVTDTEYSPPSDALLFVKNTSLSLVPVGAQWSFLGAAGSDVWILPKVQDPNLLFLGFGAEEIADGTFVGNQFTMSLKGVTGPGQFSVYDVDSFGDPVLWMNSGDGISGADSRVIPSGAHSHVNWAFSAPGDYTVLFEATGNSVLNGLTSSGDVAYNFRVEAVPEPGTLALAGVGALTLFLVRRKQRN
ncbi:MAG: choice-of-anchor M domain-containing protein [Verrucomicrobia bacterium]|nr:choice-of-anchor M domain-containing protein [Verrucomicrobiota bacterium]